MKKILLLLMLLLSINSYSQILNDDVEITQIERVVDKYSEKISTSFSELVTTITPTAKEGFEIAVKLQIAKGLSYLIPTILLIIFSFLFIKEYNINKIENKLIKETHDDRYNDYEYDMSVLLVCYIIINVILIICTLLTIYDAITHLIAPEWFAIKDIINLVS